MRKLFFAAALVAALGCGQEARQSAEKAREDAGKAVASAGEAAKDAMAEASAQIAKAKEEFLAAMEPQLEQLDRQIADLEGQARLKSGEAKRAAEKAVAELKAQREVVAKALDDARKEGAEAWAETQKSLSEGMDKLRRATEAAQKELKK
jgi:hypothetical protein